MEDQQKADAMVEAFKPLAELQDTSCILAYERIKPEIYQAFGLGEREHILVRRPFRWMLDGAVVSNAYEMHGVSSPLELLGMEIVESYGEHIHIVRKVQEIL